MSLRRFLFYIYFHCQQYYKLLLLGYFCIVLAQLFSHKNKPRTDMAEKQSSLKSGSQVEKPPILVACPAMPPVGQHMRESN